MTLMFARRSVLAMMAALTACAPLSARDAALSGDGWQVVASYPHDRSAFTQGLLWHDGSLYESTGQYGRSEIRQVRLTDGKVLRRAAVDPGVFGEGMVIWGDRIISLSWLNGTGFVWQLSDFTPIGTFSYDGEGWGLTRDANHLIMSDGSHQLRLLDPQSYAETGRVSVQWNGRPVRLLNELEMVGDTLFANVWMTDLIARIDPVTGDVKGWLDLAPLRQDAGVTGHDAVLNGIAWDAAGKRLFVTGKLWPKLYELRLTAN